MKKIVFASGNYNKLKEVQSILNDYEVILAKDLGFTEEIEETGSTFYENALIKAKTVSLALNLPALADDSGLCVESLNGRPGIFSARYSIEGTCKSNNLKLLKELKGVKNRKAKFVCTLVYYTPSGKIISADGVIEGKILEKERGENGFGYDPLFYSIEYKKSLAEISMEEKNTISHRFRALKKLKEKLEGESL